MRRLHGQLVHWNDARGFGFVLAEDGQRYFIHVSSIARIATRPREGDTISFVAAKGKKGQLEARSAVVEGANPVAPSQGPVRRELDWQIVLALTLIGLLAYLASRELLALWLFVPYAMAGGIAFFTYLADKRAAEAQAWRVSETALHLLDLCFGIIGGLLAQSLFRHKTRKTGFMLVTLGIGFIHLALLAALALGDVELKTVLSWPDALSRVR